MMNRIHLNWLICIFITGLLIFLSFNKHSKAGYFNYQSEIWADKAGYYVYLPAALKFGFDPNQFPDSIDIKTGHGFELDFSQEKVFTKYHYGVSLLQLPFFLMAELVATVSGQGPPGFSPVHHWMMNIAAVIYAIIGGIFLFLFLRKRYDVRTVYFVLFSLLLGTPLFHYAIDETGMSHIYSFALFCIFLYLLQVSGYLRKSEYKYLIMIGLAAGLIVVTRPSNILFLTAAFFVDTDGFADIKRRIGNLNLRTIIVLLSSFIVVLIPQLVYWQYCCGSFLMYSYGEEGFNWLQPKLLELWFSTNNGLFLYTPFFFIIVLSLIYSFKKRNSSDWYYLSLFVIISYVFASWWQWSFGCSFGSRNFVEYAAVFSMPLAKYYTRLSRKNKMKRIGVAFLILILIAFNLKMIYTYDQCYFGHGSWDWQYYFEQLVLAPTK